MLKAVGTVLPFTTERLRKSTSSSSIVAQQVFENGLGIHALLYRCDFGSHFGDMPQIGPQYFAHFSTQPLFNDVRSLDIGLGQQQ